MSDLPRTLFTGRRSTAVTWYRCVLPAEFLGQDWIAVEDGDGELVRKTGTPGVELDPVAWAERYDVVVLNQPRGRRWMPVIRTLQAAGTKVIFEIDDYVHAVRKKRDHEFRGAFGKEVLREYEQAMRACDAVICSTPWLGRRYRAFNPETYVCRNGLDLGRYALTRPARDRVTIGWAGATGHKDAVRPWLAAVADVMRARPHVDFLAIGQPWHRPLAAEFGEERARGIPFMALESYPAAMTAMDVALAPAGKSNFFRGKSDLRFLEAGALRLATIADPGVYPTLEHGVSGLHAETPDEVREHLLALVDDGALRDRLGASARAYVERERSMTVMAAQWDAVLRAVTGRPAAGAPAPRVTAPLPA
jgi:glycosyltransferase involved in cell wall biosynthesis